MVKETIYIVKETWTYRQAMVRTVRVRLARDRKVQTACQPGCIQRKKRKHGPGVCGLTDIAISSLAG